MVEAHSCPSVSKLKLRFYSLYNGLFSLCNSVIQGSNCPLLAHYDFYFVWCLVVNTREMVHQILLHPKKQKLSMFGYFLYLVYSLWIFFLLSFVELRDFFSFQLLFLHWFASYVLLLYFFKSQHNIFNMVA